MTGSVDTYTVIEEYPRNPASRYLPACLVYAEYAGEASHILFALDWAGDTVRIITVYHPDPGQWEPDFRRRKNS